MKTELLIDTAPKGKYITNGDDLSSAVKAMLTEAVQFHPDDEHYNLIKAELEKHGDSYTWTYDRINRDWELSPEFAERLRRLDFVYPRAFRPKTKVAEALIELLEYSDSILLLHNRTWIGTDHLRLGFILCHIDKKYDLLDDVTTGRIC